MFYESFDQELVLKYAVTVHQNDIIAQLMTYYYDTYAKNKEQKTMIFQKEQEYKISEHTITDAYLQHLEVLRTKNQTYDGL